MKQFSLFTKLTWGLVLVVLIVLPFGACTTRSRGRSAVATDARSSAAPLHININTASAQELEQLPGVGKVIAERIVAYREQNGRFKRREEVMMVNGISERKYEEIRSMIVVE
jgi:comEA protein